MMKIRMLIIVLLTGFLGLSTEAVTVTIDSGAMNSGWMAVYELGSGDETPPLWESSWGVADLSAYYDTYGVELEMVPNSIDDPAEYWYQGGGGPGSPGNKIMEASLRNETTGVYSGQVLTFKGTVVSNTLTSEHTANLFIRDFAADYSSHVEAVYPITSTGPFEISLLCDPDPTRHVQYGIQMKGVNVWVTDLEPYGSVVVQAEGDGVAPTPNPMAFAEEPKGISDVAISMTATNATDANPVEYYFTCTSGSGHDSDWQSDPVYIDTGLTPGSTNSYTVKARDILGDIETAPSGEFEAVTLAGDFDPPEPNPMTFAETEASSVSIKLTATTVTDESPVEYFFENLDGGGNDSDWQSSPVYVDTGLMPGSNYTYTVRARDLSSNMNTNGTSEAVVVTTSALPDSGALVNSLQGFTGDNTQGLTVHELALAGLETTSNDVVKIVNFDAAGATFGDSATWQSRNVLRTLAQDYGDSGFEVYATFVTQNTHEQVGFIGVGQGLLGEWGIPDFYMPGVNAVNAEIKGSSCTMWTWTNGVVAVSDETTGVATFTNRVRMVHDADAATITIELDTDYQGGDFVSDRTLGVQSTVGVWEDMPQRIYLAAGAGVLWKDLSIATAALINPETLSISGPVAGGGMVLTWDTVIAQQYDVQYKTSLSAGTWIPDPSPGCSDVEGTGGNVSATSTVSATEVFYQVVPK